jgi:peptidoglycan/LPS O-acetylase OafA/YrhL
MSNKLDRPTSVYLNAVRFTAALIVFLGHISGHRFTSGLFWQMTAFMDLAVMIFFVLSGFVIAYVTDTGESDLHIYAVNRISRIYSVALPALILTFTLDTIGRYLRPELYNEGWGFSSQHIWLQYLAGFTFTNELWWKQVYVGSDLPYWSLGYEVWYYIILPSSSFCAGPKDIGSPGLPA